MDTKTDIRTEAGICHSRLKSWAGRISRRTATICAGTIEKSLVDDLTASVTPNDAKLMKFFGMYQQDDRDFRMNDVGKS